ncbi:Uncharacterised protein [Streptococcus pneumoniae]|nr:Uncharacterised protein [Streptococcus pneumoniae]
MSMDATQYEGNAVKKNAIERITRSVRCPLVNALTTPRHMDVTMTDTLEINVNFNVFINAGPIRSDTGSPVI